ncbi:MAG TPA: peptidoglycan-associated lipoprotein, partial [Xanthobacteraceae bacterium]|nr:peptidoglycan-associated lipoprotein [Xanthobacteraceae bacterium]
MSVTTIFRAAKLAAVVVAVIGLAACANNPNGQQQAGAGGAGAAVPGSAQDFVVNVGDRVFFET